MFKVGDRVRLTKEWQGILSGELGTIQEIDGHPVWPYEVKLDKDINGDSTTWSCAEYEIEKVED